MHTSFFSLNNHDDVATATRPMVDNISMILNLIRDDRIQVHRTRIICPCNNNKVIGIKIA